MKGSNLSLLPCFFIFKVEFCCVAPAILQIFCLKLPNARLQACVSVLGLEHYYLYCEFICSSFSYLCKAGFLLFMRVCVYVCIYQRIPDWPGTHGNPFILAFQVLDYSLVPPYSVLNRMVILNPLFFSVLYSQLSCLCG